MPWALFALYSPYAVYQKGFEHGDTNDQSPLTHPLPRTIPPHWPPSLIDFLDSELHSEFRS